MKLMPKVTLLISLVVLLSFAGISPAVPLPAQAANSPLYLPIVQKSCAQSFELVPPDDLAKEQAMAAAINAERAANGLLPVALAPKLTQAARFHSRDMADKNFFSHTGSNGSSPGDRITQACYRWSAYGEIIAAGSGDVDVILDMWMNSPGHHDIILDPNYTDFGVGYARNGNSAYVHYWTVDFGNSY
jgi:uncharacterized protein YkwD